MLEELDEDELVDEAIPLELDDDELDDGSPLELDDAGGVLDEDEG